MCALKTIQELCRAGFAAHEAGDALNAEFLLHQAYARARELKSPVLEAKLLNTMAVFAMADRRPGKAVPLLLEAREKVDARVGRNNKLYAVIAKNLLAAENAAGVRAAA